MLSGLQNPVGISKGIISTFGRLSKKGVQFCRMAMNEKEGL